MASKDPSDLVDLPRRGQRLLLAAALCGLTLCFALLIGRLFQIQILDHERHIASAHRMRRTTDPILAYRGDLRSRDGIIFARSVLAYEVGLDPQKVSRERLPALVRLVSDALEYPAERRWRLLERCQKRQAEKGKYVRFGTGVEPSLVPVIRNALGTFLPEKETEAFVATASTRRVYPHGSFLASVIGVADLDGRGIEGVEKELDAYLAARPGRRQVVRDALRKARVYFPENAEVPPLHGYDVDLTIDAGMQGILEEELEKGIEEHQAAAGQAVIMDCRNGAVLAMASWPTYDPNRFSDYPPPERQRRRKNRVVENLFEPGSVMKSFIIAMVLEKGVHGRHQPVWGGGTHLRLRHRTVRDVTDHGPITLEGALVHSSNIGMSILGLKLGIDGLIETLDAFGFCGSTGIDLPGEARFRCKPREEWREEFTAVSVSFGYEVQVTPIGLCTAFASVINGGYLMRPRVVERLRRGGEELANPPEIFSRPISEDTSRVMREILLEVVQEGTGRFLQLEGLDFGGKTGTADMDPRYTEKDYLASFIAFAPFENPQLVVLAMIEKPRGRYYGGWVAGPVVARVLCRLFHVEPRPESVAMR